MKYYCIGIKGTGMSTLAQMLSDMGHQVVGYDDAKDFKFTEKGLKERDIPIYYDGSYPLDHDMIITASKAFLDTHKEIQRVKSLGLKITPYNEVVGMITREFKTISVCGTHGKTTTTSLLKQLLSPCNYFIGDGSGYVNMENDTLVIESDEFNRHFLAYSPKICLITCIELEHTEIYKDIYDIIQTFETFANKSELVIANGDDENIRKIKFEKEVYFYGEKEDNDYIIRNIELKESGSSFDLYKKNEFLGNYEVPLYGRHMIYNTALSVILALLEGKEEEEIKKRLKTFQNAARRFQEEKVGDTIIIDDYAHHPTEVKVTLEAVRQKYPDKRLVVVFRPNTYSRTSKFKSEFADSLKVADKAYITPILCDREDPKAYPDIKSEDIMALVPDCELVEEESVEKLKKEKGCVVCFMGCATVSHLIDNFKKVIS